MLEDPEFDLAGLKAALHVAWSIEATAFAFVPGHDLQAATYDVTAGEARWFLKVRIGSVADASLDIPRALLDLGIPNVIAPVPTVAGALRHPMGDGRTLALYPFVAGRNAKAAGLTADQWRAFGTALRAVHDSGLEATFADRLPVEAFALPSAAVLRDALALARRPPVVSPAGDRLAALLDAEAARIGAMLERAEEFGGRLAHRSFTRVLCHVDIHAANILVADDGRIFLVDWDGPMLAPREHDMLFVIGSRIARRVEPHEEARFFEGYGPVPVDLEALFYYRYERMIETSASTRSRCSPILSCRRPRASHPLPYWRASSNLAGSRRMSRVATGDLVTDQ